MVVPPAVAHQQCFWQRTSRRRCRKKRTTEAGSCGHPAGCMARVRHQAIGRGGKGDDVGEKVGPVVPKRYHKKEVLRRKVSGVLFFVLNLFETGLVFWGAEIRLLLGQHSSQGLATGNRHDRPTCRDRKNKYSTATRVFTCNSFACRTSQHEIPPPLLPRLLPAPPFSFVPIQPVQGEGLSPFKPYVGDAQHDFG